MEEVRESTSPEGEKTREPIRTFVPAQSLYDVELLRSAPSG